MRSLDISAFIVVYQNLLLVHLPHNKRNFEEETLHTYNLLFPFKIKSSMLFPPTVHVAVLSQVSFIHNNN